MAVPVIGRPVLNIVLRALT